MPQHIPRIGVAILCLPHAIWSASHDPVIVVESDSLAIEAEIEPVPTGWTFEQDVAGYQGSGFLRWSAPNAYNSPGTGELRYRLLITTAGRYRIDLRLNTKGAEKSDLGNDAYTRCDDGAWVKTFVGGGSADGWATRTRLEPTHGKFAEPVYDLATGLHTFAISGRSHGLRIDRLIIAREDHKKPSDTMPAVTGLPAIPAELTDPAVRAAWLQGGLGAVLKWTDKRATEAGAKLAAQTLNADVDVRLSKITAWREQDVMIALDLLENLTAQYQGSERGRELLKLLKAWNSEPQVTKERKARDMASEIDQLLANHAKETDPARKAALAGAIGQGLQQMRKSCPGTTALADLERRVGAAGLTRQ